MRQLLLAPTILFAFTTAALCAEPGLPGIEKIEFGQSAHLVVNGQAFLPIMSWAQSPRRYPMLHELGFNTHAGGNADPDAAQKAEAYAVAPFKKEWAGHPYLLGWLQGDEPDMPKAKESPPQPKTGPEVLEARYQEMRKAGGLLPVFLTFTENFTKDRSKYSADQHDKLYSQFATCADVLGFDVYPIYGSGYAGHLNYVGDDTAELRQLAGAKRPVYAWIETCKGSQWMSYEKQPDVLPMHTRNEVWQAIVNGATGIGYFTHAWRPTFSEFAPTEAMQKELKRLNGQLTRLAPAILAVPSKSAITMKAANAVQCQFKATEYEGATYIFALNRDLGVDTKKARQFDPIKPREAEVTLTVPGLKAGVSIEVIDENRSITAGAGTFSDHFQPLSEHIYKILR